MEPRNIPDAIELTDVWPLILANLNEINIQSMMIANKYFKNLVEKSKLLQRPQWFWADYSQIAATTELVNPFQYIYDSYPLKNGNMAFGLNFNPSKLGGKSATTYRKKCQNILIFLAGKEKPVELKGHKGAIHFIGELDGGIIVSVGCDSTLRLWSKKSAQQKNLFHLKNIHHKIKIVLLDQTRLACIHHTGEADVWNVLTGEYLEKIFLVKQDPELPIEAQHIRIRNWQAGLLLIEHNSFSNARPFCMNSNNTLTVWDIKQKKVIDKVDLYALVKNLNKHLVNAYQSENFVPPGFDDYLFQFIDYKDGMVIIKGSLSFYFIDTKNENTIFPFPSIATQYRFMENGNIIILTHIPNEILIFADYCFETKNFNIKFRAPDFTNNSKNIFYHSDYFSDRAWAILPNGNIVTYYWESGVSRLWDLATKFMSEIFQLEAPHIPFVEKNICKSRELKGLPNGNILACDYNGAIAIWNGENGQLLLNENVTTVNEMNPNLVAQHFTCREILPNGNLFVQWKDTHKTDWKVGDYYKEKLLRFSMWDKLPKDNSCLDKLKDETNMTFSLKQ
jgi:WD40 repeat protein